MITEITKHFVQRNGAQTVLDQLTPVEKSEYLDSTAMAYFSRAQHSIAPPSVT